MTGTELKIKRIAAHVKQIHLAEAMGWRQSKVSVLEAKDHVDPTIVAEYEQALATLTTTTTPAGVEAGAI